MPWPFKSLQAFSFRSTGLRVQSLDRPQSLPPKEQNSFNSSIQVVPVTEVGTTEQNSSTEQEIRCQCGHQPHLFCPYCEYDRSARMGGSIFLQRSTSSPDIAESVNYAQMDGSDGPGPSIPRPRKLKKMRSDYQQIQYEVLDIEAVISARPNSILSNHSRTPLLNHGQKSKPIDYLALPPERKPPKKLEKKGKRQRASSIPNHSALYSTFSGLADEPQGPQRVIKVVKSKSFLNSKNDRTYGPRPPPISESIYTDALVSLAWTGDASFNALEHGVATSDNSASPEYRGSPPYSLSPTSSIVEQDYFPRPKNVSEPSTPGGDKVRSTLRKQKDPEVPLTRPWTMAMVITDDGITDEKLVDALEDMRIKDRVGQNVIPDEYPFQVRMPPDYRTQLYDSFAEYPPQYGEAISEPISPSDLSWSSARQALLICRELVRTERRYVSSLRTLITSGTSTPPPSQMLSYLPSLIEASDALLKLMEENPSVKGVSEAFLSCSEALRKSFTSWCSVVGHFFDTEDGPKGKRSSQDLVELRLLEARSRMQGLPAEDDLPIVVSEPNKIRKNSKARPSVRDLAILPTQRIVRYVLLYKELRALTPTTHYSFSFVESAVRAAESIARSADEAQGHKAFLQPDP